MKKTERGWSLIEVLAAIIVVGIGIALFTKVQRMTGRDSTTNSKILMAGKMIENHIEDIRIKIAKDTTKNFPPSDDTLASVAPNFITVTTTVTKAYSPIGAKPEVPNVRQIDLKAKWTNPNVDSLQVTTYVSKNF